MHRIKNIIKNFFPRFLISWYHFCLAWLGALIYGFPSRKMIIIGVTGTRGKTTTANFIWSCLTSAGYKVGLTGTANIRIAEKESLNPYHMTMPGRFILQKLLSQMHKAGCQYVIIETPSEGVEQWRHKGIFYDVAVFTTLYPEYLEVHNWDFERCKEMQLKIFASLKKPQRNIFGILRGRQNKIINGKEIPKVIVVNNDSPDKNLFLQFSADKKVTYGISSAADFVAKNISATSQGVGFSIDSQKYELSILGYFNVHNALAAIATVSVFGLSYEAIKNGLKNLEKVPGRMEKIENSQPFDVFVDYAHDKVSLESVLKAVKDIKRSASNKVILLLGAEGGGRDKAKRPIMGQIAAREADFIVVSNVDPYDDDPKEIMEDIAQASEKLGKIRGKDLLVIEDRKEGIRKALSLAKKGDIVLITGKGAEQTINIYGKSSPWDDRKVVREELNQLMVN